MEERKEREKVREQHTEKGRRERGRGNLIWVREKET